MTVAKTKKEKVIEIPEPEIGHAIVTIEGKTPLIVNRFGERAQAEIEAKQQGSAKLKRAPRDPDAEFQDKLYKLNNGDGKEHYGFPAAGIKKALVSAGGRYADEKMTVLRGVLNIIGDLVEIEGGHKGPVMRTDTVRLASGVASLAYRPMFKPWEMKIEIRYNKNAIQLPQLLNLFQIAGFSIGLGDWRPEKNGNFGQFCIKKGGVEDLD